jgi:hypothetical protein
MSLNKKGDLDLKTELEAMKKAREISLNPAFSPHNSFDYEYYLESMQIDYFRYVFLAKLKDGGIQTFWDVDTLEFHLEKKRNFFSFFYGKKDYIAASMEGTNIRSYETKKIPMKRTVMVEKLRMKK